MHLSTWHTPSVSQSGVTVYKGFLPVTAACDTPDMMEVAAATFALFSMGTELEFNSDNCRNSARVERG